MQTAGTEITKPLHLNPYIMATAICLVAVIVYALIMRDSPFFTRGEAREALVVEAMSESDNIFLPITNADQISTKPPFFHWIAFGISEVAGRVSEFYVRLPSVISAALSLAILFLFVQRHLGIQSALLSTLLLSTALEWVRSASHARVDMCLVLGIVIACCSIFQALFCWSEKQRGMVWWLALASLGTTIAILSKGPMGLIIPLAVAAPFAFCILPPPRFRNLLSLPYLPALSAITCALAISAVWYVISFKQQPDEFLRVHFINENLARFIEVADYEPGHRKPFYYGFIYFFTAFIPWTFFLPFLAGWLWSSREYLSSKQGKFSLFCLIWALVVIGMCLIASAKRSTYFLPAFPPVACLLAQSLIEAAKFPGRYFRSEIALSYACRLIFFLVCLTIMGVTLVVTSDSAAVFLLSSGIVRARDYDDLELLRMILSSSWSFYFFLPLIAGSIFITMFHADSRRLLKSVGAVALSIVLCVTMASISAIKSYAMITSPSQFMQMVESRVPDNAAIYQYQDVFFAPVYYADRRIKRIDDLTDLEGKSYYMLVDESQLEEFKTAEPDSSVMLQSHENAANGRGSLFLVYVQEA